MTYSVPLLTTQRLIIKPLEEDMANLVMKFELDNQERLAIWDPPKWHEDWQSVNYWQEDTKAWVESMHRGEGIVFTLFAKSYPRYIIGLATLSKIMYGPLLSAELGYKIDHRYEKQGLMREGLEKILEYVFFQMGLRRVQANYRPENTRSGLLLRHLGFEVEGYAKELVYIDGAWRDHVLTAKRHPVEEIRTVAPYVQTLEDHPWT